MPNNVNECIVTTSWDDGHLTDLLCLDLLESHKLHGTFYVCSKDLPHTLSLSSIRDIAKSQEVGAHTIDHPILTALNEREIRYQLSESKFFLEQQIGAEVKMFCYPSGEHNRLVRKVVTEVGFVGARTTASFDLQFPTDAYAMGTTLRVFPYPFVPSVGSTKDKWRYGLLRQYNMWKLISKAKLSGKAYKNWENLAEATFDYVLKNGGVWHIWGHSWEIERYQMWEQLEHILQYVSGRENVKYMTNGELITHCMKRLPTHPNHQV